jgi:hypothetical protein
MFGMSEISIIRRYCDFRNANELGHMFRCPRNHLIGGPVFAVRKTYVINDPLKTIMTPNAVHCSVPTSNCAYDRCSFANEYFKDSQINQVMFNTTQLQLENDIIVDFGDELCHFSPQDILTMFQNCSYGNVGYGYIYVPVNKDENTHPITLKEKEIGMIRRLNIGDSPRTFVGFGSEQIGYEYNYIHNGTLSIVTDPKFQFIVEIQQIDCYNLLNCCIKRFRAVKKPSKMTSFDAYLGDEIFDDDAITTNTLKSLLSNRTKDAEVVKSFNDIRELHKEYPKQSVKIADVIVTEEDQSVVLQRRKHGRIVDYYQSIVSSVPIKQQSTVYKNIKRQILNKVTLNFTNAPKLTPELVKSNLAYINSACKGEIDIVKDGVPALIYAIKETSVVESMLTSALSSKDAELLTALKQGEFTVSPKGVIDAFKKGQLFDFISKKIRGFFHLNEVIALGKESTKLDF